MCTLYDVAESRVPAGGPGGADRQVQFLVMEYLEGETLAAHTGFGNDCRGYGSRHVAHHARRASRHSTD